MKEAKPTRENRPTGALALCAALSHPLRFRILTAMNSPERNAEPNELATEMGISVGRVAYHMRELAELGFVELVDEDPRRGAVAHVYAPVRRFEAWGLEWRDMFPAFKQIVAASALRIGVEATGASIDDGRFEAREDSIIAHDTFWTDERGAVEALAILAKALEDLLEVAADAKARLDEGGEKGALLTYLLTGFEGAIRPL